MKFKSLFSLLLVFIIGCAPAKYLTQDQTEKIFSHELSLTKEQIKQKLLVFINENYHSSKAVIQTEEDGLLSGNGIVSLKETKGLLGEVIMVTRMELTFIVKYSDNNYRVKWIVKDLLNDKGSYAKSIWGYYIEDIEKSIIENDQLMFKYLSTDQTDF